MKRQPTTTVPAASPLEAALVRACFQWPYFSTGFYTLRPVLCEGVTSGGEPTVAVSSDWRLYVHPAVFAKWTVAQLASVMRHELEHLLRDHATRRADRDAEAWNVCADCEINQGDWATGLPGGCVTPASLQVPAGELAEQTYDRLPRRPGGEGKGGKESSGEEGRGGRRPGPGQPGPGQPGGQPGGQGGQGEREEREGREGGSGSDGGQEPRGEPRGGQGPGGGSDGQPVRRPGHGAGSGSDGAPRDWEQGGEGVDEVTREVVRRKTAQDVRDEACRGRGTVPGGLATWAESVLAPKVDWRRELARTVRGELNRAGAADYSWSRISRRSPPGLYCPALRGRSLRVAVVVDTSGSVSDQMLATAHSEVVGIVKAAGAECVEVTCDAQVHDVRRAGSSASYAGRGGTDMRVGIARALESRPRPHVVVVLTDCLTPWPEQQTAVPLVVASLAEKPSGVPAWARVVEVVP